MESINLYSQAHVNIQSELSPSDLARQIILTASDSEHFLTLLPVGLSVFVVILIVITLSTLHTMCVCNLLY